MALTLDLRPLVIVRAYAGGSFYAYPLAAPGLVVRGRSPDATEAELSAFLSKLLAELPADKLADYTYPEGSELIDLPVVIPRSDLPRRVRILSELAIPCVVVPDGEARWVHVLPLAHTVYVRPGEELQRRVSDEIRRAAQAREIVAAEYRGLLPADAHRIVRATVSVERSEHEDLGKRSAKRRAQEGERARKEARELLDKVAVNLAVEHFRKRRGVAPVIARAREINSLVALLTGAERLSVMLVGAEMAGKTAIVDGALALPGSPFRLSSSARPIYATSGAQLVAGQSGFGQLEERVDAVMKAAELLDAVLYFDDLGDLFAGHSGGIEDLASIMRPYLVEGRVRVLGELTPELVRQHEKRHVGFFACLHRVTVAPLDVDVTRELLRERVAFAERTKPEGPRFALEAVDPLVELAARYLNYQAFPGKAVRMYEELLAVHEADLAHGASQDRRVGPRHVYRAFSTRSGIPMFLLRPAQTMKYDAVLEFFRRHVIGQREAIRGVAETLCAVKAGLQPPGKPLANFLFVGPTGVGKTEVAKTLARFLFGGVERMVRFDMSEYMDALAAERLIRGSRRDEGELTRRVRQQPFCVVLLDEIEKAHPAVFDLLLQVCGEGRLTDARGKTTHFENAIIIMTSNLGAAHRRPAAGFGLAARELGDDETVSRYYVERVESHFRPEFVNRIDRIIPFRALTRAEIREVADVALSRICERAGFVNRAITLRVSPAALELVANAGYSDTYGARALRRHLERALIAPLAGRLSRLGKDAAGATLRVFLDAEGPEAAGEGGGATVERRAMDGAPGGDAFVVEVSRPPADEQRGSSHAFAFVAGLRRMARSCLNLGPIAEMRERMEQLVAEMATASLPPELRAKEDDAKTRERALYPRADLGVLTAEHARLREAVGALTEEIEAIEAAEDLALMALYEGESSDDYSREAYEAFARLERALVRAVLDRADGGSGVVLRLQPQDEPVAVKLWLLPFLEAVERRGWQCRVHLWEDASSKDDEGEGRERAGEAEREPGGARADDWPQDLSWGPPRAGAWALKQLRAIEDEGDEKALAQRWRGVLLCVHGPLASALLRFELGLHRWAPNRERDAVCHLLISWCVDAFTLGPDVLRKPDDARKPYPFDLPARTPRDQLAKIEPVRVWRDNGELEVPPANALYRAYFAEEYWDNLERFVFELMAGPLSRGEDPVPEETPL